MNTRGQQIIFSTVIMVFVFFLIVTLFTGYMLRNPSLTSGSYELVERESIRLANSLVRSGYPSQWHLGDWANVQKIGFVDDGELTIGKVNLMRSNIVDRAGYESVKKFLSIQQDYLIVFDASRFGSSTLTINALCDHDLPGASDCSGALSYVSENAKVVASQERIVTVINGGDQEPLVMQVVVYQ